MKDVDDRIRSAISPLVKDGEFVLDVGIVIAFKDADGEQWLRLLGTDTPAWTMEGMFRSGMRMLYEDNDEEMS